MGNPDVIFVKRRGLLVVARGWPATVVAIGAALAIGGRGPRRSGARARFLVVNKKEYSSPPLFDFKISCSVAKESRRDGDPFHSLDFSPKTRRGTWSEPGEGGTMRLAARIFVYFVAFLLSLPELIAAGKWLGRAVEQLLRWGEHAEFVVHRLEDLRSSRLGDYIPEIPQWASIICLGFAVALVLWDNRRSRRFALARGTHLPSPASHPSWWRAKRKSPFVSVEMWMQPRSYRDPSEVIAKIDGLRRQDGLTVLVRYAEAIHTESESHWKWSQTHRLVQQSNIVQGEKLRPSVLFRPNEGEDEIRAAGGQTYKVGDGLLLLVEIRAIAASETIVARAPFHFRNIGGTRLSEPSRLDELGYIKNLDG